MKRSYFTFFWVGFGLIFLTSLAFGGEPNPTNHPKQVYVDPQTHTIYWPKTMPFYVRLATGPEKNAPSFLLQNIFSRTEGEEKTDARKGVSLDLSGRQFLRWHNYVTGDSILFVFYSDGDAPVLALHLEGAASCHSGQGIIYGAGLKGTLTARDSLSGVQDIWVAIDQADFAPYKTPFSFTQEKSYQIRAYAVDRVGNVSPVLSKSFTVDLTPPKTERRILAAAIGNVLSPLAQIELKASDSSAGVAHTYFRFDSSQTYSVYSGNPISVGKLSTGAHRLTYYSIDRVGNKEDTTVFRFYLDNKAPELNTFVLGDQFIQKTTVFVSPRSKIKFQAEDNRIGVKTVEYAFNKGSFQSYTQPFVLPSDQKMLAIVYRVKDKLGNVSAKGRLVFHMDALPPESQLRFDGPHFEQRGHFWISSTTQIVLSAKDADSGVQGIKFQIGDDPESSYEKPFSLEKEGPYVLHFYAVDRVNNTERPHTIAVVVDNTPPKIVMNFSSAPISGADADSTAPAYPLETSLFLGSTDASAGAAGVWYSLNGNTEKQYRSPIVFKKPGSYEITVRTEDRVGNQAVKKVNFLVKE